MCVCVCVRVHGCSELHTAQLSTGYENHAYCKTYKSMPSSSLYHTMGYQNPPYTSLHYQDHHVTVMSTLHAQHTTESLSLSNPCTLKLLLPYPAELMVIEVMPALPTFWLKIREPVLTFQAWGERG